MALNSKENRRELAEEVVDGMDDNQIEAFVKDALEEKYLKDDIFFQTEWNKMDLKEEESNGT
jgi:hypothetical protein